MSEEKLPSAEQVEAVMLEKEKTSKSDPLDTHATFFYFYIFRFKQQLNMMSKKELVRLINSLVGSEFNKEIEIKRLLRLVDGLNLNSIHRALINVVEFPLNEKEIKSMSKNEKEVFDLMDSLIAEKYVSCLESANNIDEKTTVQDIIKHLFDEKEFKKRKNVEKDAFATANQLICSKTLLIQHTVLEQIKFEEEKKKEEENGKSN